MADSVCVFPKSSRLLTSTDYSQVFGDASAVSDSAFTVLCRANDLGYPRLGLAISKKMLRKASDRNLVKRIVRESFRLRQAELQGRDFVVLARRGLVVRQRTDMWRCLDQLWKRAVKRCPVKPAVSCDDSCRESDSLSP